MDIALVLFLPLIGGYWFSSTWDLTKYKCSREDGHRLYFRAVTYAIILFSIAFILRAILSNFEFYQGFEALIRSLIKPYMKEPDKFYKSVVLLTSVYSLLLGIVSSHALNKICPELSDGAINKAVKNNDFERLIFDAVKRVIPICLSMENNKVYVGYVVTTTDPTVERKAIGILPLMSGYTNNEGRIKFTTFYTPIYEELKKNNSKYKVDAPRDFEKVLPTSLIQSANLFDVKIYESFQNNSNSNEDEIEEI